MSGMVPSPNPYFLPAYYGSARWTGSMLQLNAGAVVMAKLAATAQAARPGPSAKRPHGRRPTPTVSVEVVGTTPAASGARYAFKAVLTDPLSAEWSAPTVVHFSGRYSQFKTMFKQLQAEGMVDSGRGCVFPANTLDHLRNMATDPHNVNRRAEELRKFWSAILSSSSAKKRSATFERITGFTAPGAASCSELNAAAVPTANTEGALPVIMEAEESRDGHGIDGADEPSAASASYTPAQAAGSSLTFHLLPRKSSSFTRPVSTSCMGAQSAGPGWLINCGNAGPARSLRRARSL